MKRMLWISTHPNGGWRQHLPGKRDTIHLQNREEALKNAREIANKHKILLEKSPFKNTDWRKWCGRDPFPPRY